MRDAIKFGIVGLGPISRKHIEGITRTAGLELSGVCDLNKDLLEKTVATLNEGAGKNSGGQDSSVKGFSSFEEMLADPKIEAISICTPSGTHRDLAVKAAKVGKHVVCEKPLALNSRDAREIIEACEKAGVQLFVVKQNRFNPPIQRLKEAIDAGRMGRLLMGNVNVFWNRNEAYYKGAPWRGSKEMDGGVLLNQAAHHVDMLIWLMGMPVQVQGLCATFKAPIEAEDSAISMMQFENGAMATLQATTATFRKNYEGSATLLGERGLAKIGGLCFDRIEKWDFEDFRNEDELIEKFSIVPPDIFAYGHIKVYENVLLTLKADHKVAVDGLEALKTIMLVEAIYESAETGKAVKIDMGLWKRGHQGLENFSKGASAMAEGEKADVLFN